MSGNSKDSSTDNFPVVGIGASASGLEAIKLFLKRVPEKSGMAYVYVQHLSPQHESALTKILSHHFK
jgi:two-component system CheB/CheR fusion protein